MVGMVGYTLMETVSDGVCRHPARKHRRVGGSEALASVCQREGPLGAGRRPSLRHHG